MFWVMSLLTIALLGQWTLWNHLEAAGALPVGELQQSLERFPLELGAWSGVEVPIENADWLYADEHLQRRYQNRESGSEVQLWIAFSQTGKDRGHHPQICMAVAGQREDPTARKTLALPGDGEDAQQYRFGRLPKSEWVFYWHYTLLPDAPEAGDSLQRLYHRLRNRPASLTIEVFAPAVGPLDESNAQDFARKVDEAIRDFVGPDAVRGSHRAPIEIIRTEPPHD
jgi:hypothetical protein